MIEGLSGAGPGLCASCGFSRRVESRRGSVFLLCEMSFADSRFPRYPSLPVLRCSGWRPEPGAGEEEAAGSGE
jgi:hypothetical protein